MMHRKGAKRIRMDDSVPPENETPMTPMNDNSSGDDDSYNAYTPYNQASQIPLHDPTPEHYFESHSSPGTSQQQYQKQSDSDAKMSLKEEGFFDFDEFIKDVKLMNALLPEFSYDVILFAHFKNRFAKNCFELTLRDLVSVDRPFQLHIETRIETLLNCEQENISSEKTEPLPEATDANLVYDINERYEDLLRIFPEADPVYLRKVAVQIYSDPKLMEFIQSKLENPDYLARAQYLDKKEITKQQKQYTTDFRVQQFLEIFPDPFLHFEDNKRKCNFNVHAEDFLKFHFRKLKKDTLLKMYRKHIYNLSLTAKALETLKPDMKTKRQCKTLYETILTKNIPFLQECAFIQHKAELRKYMDDVKTKKEQEFNELKEKNLLLKCQCCYNDECVPSKCWACEKRHIFCYSCIIKRTDVVLKYGNTRIDCLLECGYEFPISVLQRILPPTKFSILLCKRQEAGLQVMAAELEGLVLCPFCHFAAIPPPEDKIFKCFNPICMKESCRLCKKLNHIPLNCIEKNTEFERLYLEEKMTQALVRKCYHCKRVFFKEEGCNKMTCVCGAQMCYICDKPVTNYNHFQGQGAESSNRCPLWSDNRRLNAESVNKVYQETVQQIKEKDPEVDINFNALLLELPPESRGPRENIP